MSELIPVEGPSCDPWEVPVGICHQSCAAIEASYYPEVYDDLSLCRKHGYQTIIGQGHNDGFGAGFVYWTNLACGCTDMDDCSYLET
jgi:hypothetical protein